MQAKDVLQRCPLCHEPYRDDALFPLEDQPRGRLYHCYCASCKRSMLAVLCETSGWLSSVGILTELTAHEARRSVSLPSVDGDLCVRAHLAFGGEGSGEFCRFLQKQAENPASFRS